MDLKLFLQANWDRALGWSAIALGCVALWLGWLGISGTALTHEQLPYLISGGLFGLALIAVGSTLLLSADLRDEWRKLDKIEESLHRASEQQRTDELDGRDPVAQAGARAPRLVSIGSGESR